MIADEFARLEYERLAAEERDRMNGRMQVWTVYLTIVGAFGFVTFQSGMGADVVVLCPLLLACLARHARHSEDVLRQVRKYLYKLEADASYQGYEHFTREATRPTRGGYRAALRDAFLLTDVLAVGSVFVRLYGDHVALWVLGTVAIVDGIAIVLTWRWFTRSKKKVAPKPVSAGSRQQQGA